MGCYVAVYKKGMWHLEEGDGEEKKSSSIRLLCICGTEDVVLSS